MLIIQMGQASVIYFINTSIELNHVLYSSGIDPDLAPQHHSPPGSWAWSWQGHKGQISHMWYLGEMVMDLSYIKHLIMHNLTIYKLIPSFRSRFDHHDEQLCHIHNFTHGPAHERGGVQMMRILYLLGMIVEYTSLSCPWVVVMLVHDDRTSHRSGFDHHGQ